MVWAMRASVCQVMSARFKALPVLERSPIPECSSLLSETYSTARTCNSSRHFANKIMGISRGHPRTLPSERSTLEPSRMIGSGGGEPADEAALVGAAADGAEGVAGG